MTEAAPAGMLPTTILPPPVGSALAWFCNEGWFTVELDAGYTMAISPRTDLTPHWVVTVRGVILRAIGGGSDPRFVWALADAFARQHGRGVAWSVAQLDRWGRRAVSSGQARLLRGICDSREEYRAILPEIVDRGTASGMIDWLRTRLMLREARRFFTDELPADDVPRWSEDALRRALDEEALHLAGYVADGLPRPSPAALPFIATGAFRELTAWAEQAAREQAIGVLVAPPGSGSSTALTELCAALGRGRWRACALQKGVKTPMPLLQTIYTAITGRVIPVRQGIEQLMDAVTGALRRHEIALLAVDHLVSGAGPLIHTLENLKRRYPMGLILVPPATAAPRLAARIAAHGDATLPPLTLPTLDRIAVRDLVLPDWLAAIGATCDLDERDWVADELARNGAEWRALAGLLAETAEVLREAGTMALTFDLAQRAALRYAARQRQQAIKGGSH